MTKKEDKASADVSVKLTCVYSGHPDNPGPGDTVAVDAEEAARLISIGAATAVEAAATTEPQT